MFQSIKLGKAFGIALFIHWSFLLFLPLFVLFNTVGSGLSAAVFLAVLLAGIFGCVLLHELGHALMARRFGITTRDITLYPIGGVARLERMSERPWEEFCIAIAGPAVNVVIAALLGLIVFGFGMPLSQLSMTYEPALTPGINLLGSLLLANVGLVVFNLLPAFPMDGGRVLRALLAVPLGHVPATEIAATLGIVMAALFGVVGVLSNPMLILVALFVYFAGQQELAAVRHRHAQRRAEPLDVLPADEDRVPVPAQRANGRFSGITWDQRFQVWVQWRNGRPIAIYGADAE